MNTQTIIINRLLATLINYEPYYPWYRYIYNTYLTQASLQECFTGVIDLSKEREPDPFSKLEAYLATHAADPNKRIVVIINTDDEILEFPQDYTDQDLLDANALFTTFPTFPDYTFYLIFD